MAAAADDGVALLSLGCVELVAAEAAEVDVALEPSG